VRTKFDIFVFIETRVTGVIGGAGTAYPSGAHEFTPGF